LTVNDSIEMSLNHQLCLSSYRSSMGPSRSFEENNSLTIHNVFIHAVKLI